nr:hypothetical protein [Tanacetum cinerariifolium]
MENPPPNDLNANLSEDEPVQPEHAHAMFGFAPVMLNMPNNNNGWIKEEMEAKEDDEEEIKVGDDEKMDDDKEEDGKDNVDDDVESEFAPRVTPVVDANLEPIPPIDQFGGNLHVGESSSTGALLAGRQMYDRYNTECRMVNKFKEDDLHMNRHEYDISALEMVGVPSKPPTDPAFVPRLDDPYAIVKDAATSAARYDGDDLAVPSDP